MIKSIRSRAPSASSALVNRVMRANKSRDTNPEKTLRSALHRRGLRFRKHCKPDVSVNCTVDVVFVSPKVCVFIDGCFWHGCPMHFFPPKINSEWWVEKIAETRARDSRQARHLRRRGWCVIRVWEHEIDCDRLPAIAKKIHQVVARRKGLA